jgi:arylsulfatase
VPGKDGQPGGYSQARVTELELYNLADDVGERKNVAAEHPDIVAKLRSAAETARADLGDSHQKRQGAGRRPAGKLP